MKTKLLLSLFSLLSINPVSASAATLSYAFYSGASGPTSVPANLLTDATLTQQSGAFGFEGSGPVSVLTDGKPATEPSTSWLFGLSLAGLAGGFYRPMFT